MDNSSEIYEVRAELTKLVSEKIAKGINTYIDKHKNDIRYFLHYPLIDIEMGLETLRAEHIENDKRRDIFGFLVSKTFSLWETLEYKQIMSIDAGYSNYKKDREVLYSVYQDNLTCLEIKDGNSYAKSRIEILNNKKYKLTTSLVTNKYKEEDFYFYRIDNILEYKKEQEFIIKNLEYFILKYVRQFGKIDKLYEELDKELLTYCKQRVESDLSKLHPKTKSSIFSSIAELIDVLSFLYYLAQVNYIKRSLYRIAGRRLINDDYLIRIPRVSLINKISNVCEIKQGKVNKIISYVTNTGSQNIFEFPLFEHGDFIFSVSSLIIVNDWAFSIVNGHYIKGISFTRREKTISLSTELKLEKSLQGVENILFSKERYYEFMNEKGTIINSDIDFAIFDIKNNVLLIIESKWKDNHYYFGYEKNHSKIEDTFNKIFNNQISKHKIFLSNRENIQNIFDPIIDIDFNNTEIFYLAIDKRNQLHLNGNHMITEYMLMYFIKENIIANKLDLPNLIKSINQLSTQTEYISIPPVVELKLNTGIIMQIDEVDLKVDYKFE